MQSIYKLFQLLFVWVLLLITHIQPSIACHKATAALVSKTDNNDGTFTYVINVCREYLGLEGNPSDLSFTFNCGVSATSFSPATYATSTSDIYTGSISAGVLNYHTPSPFIAHGSATLCGNFTITTNGHTTSVSINTHPGYPSAVCTKVIVLDLLAAPTASETHGQCSAGTINFSNTATPCPGGTLKWYDVAVGGTSVATGSPFNVVLGSTKTYYVECSKGAGTCPSARGSVTNTVICPLAVDAFSLKGACVNHNVALFWTATTQSEEDYFVIEKSFDGKVFSPQNWLKSRPNAQIPATYSYTDSSQMLQDAFYRIVHVDFNGNQTLSQNLFIHADCEANQSLIVKNYYADNELNLSLLVNQNEAITINIVDVSGRLIYNQIMPIEMGLNDLNIPIELTSGLYFIRVVSSEKTECKKMLINYN